MKEKEFYLCACANTDKGGIYRLSFGPDGLQEKGFTPITESNFIIYSKDGRTMYSTGTGADGGFISAFRVLSSGDLSLLGSVSSGGDAPCYLCMDESGKYLYCANYGSGSFSEFSIAADGTFEKHIKTVCHSGRGPHPTRQQGPHVHCTTPTQDGKYIAVVDLGADAVVFYPFGKNGADPSRAKTHSMNPGDGPRHIVFTEAGKTAYLVNELGNTLVCFDYCDGELKETGRISTLPGNCDVQTKASAVKFSPDGKRIFASNRGFTAGISYGSVICCDIGGGGMPESYAFESSGGNSPRDIAFLPGGDYFAAANEFSDQVCFFTFNKETGRLDRLAESDAVKYPRPLFFLNRI